MELLFALAWSAGGHRRRCLTSTVDGRLLEEVAVGLFVFLPLSADGELTRLRDVDGPAEEPWLVGSGWARLLLDLLGRA